MGGNIISNVTVEGVHEKQELDIKEINILAAHLF